MSEPTYQVTPYPLRLSPELRKKLEAIAQQNGRSLNAEITLRIESTFIDGFDKLKGCPDAEHIRTIIKEELSKLKQS